MKSIKNYNAFAGQNKERLAALSDGIFSIAMTLLVLELRVPDEAVKEATLHPGSQFLWMGDMLTAEGLFWTKVMSQLAPSLEVYLTSFLTLGIFWVAQQTQLNDFKRSDRNMAWIHLAFLLMVSLIPFSTGVLTDFITLRSALFIYWLNLFLLGASLFASLSYAEKAKLMREDMTAERFSGQKQRLILYQGLYLFAFLLCFINTYVSITLLVLVQLNSALAPRFLGLNRL
ncbi:MAG: DUF1211 domain-containing protein [Ktedonobacteraceae bacterium]|nr:DUF1211 domain-containing protein [Ktedonobacteraceae bacterium]